MASRPILNLRQYVINIIESRPEAVVHSSRLFKSEKILSDYLWKHRFTLSIYFGPNMACHPEQNVLPYFNTSWAVLSTIGASYVLVGVMVIGIRGGVSALLLVPIIVSAACAIANGVHYYQEYLGCPPINQAVAFVFADVAWMVSAKLMTRPTLLSLSVFPFPSASYSWSLGLQYTSH